MDVPLTFLIDDILRTIAMNQKNHFKLNRENAKNGRNHYFHFKSRKVYFTENLISNFVVNSENYV